MAEEFNYLENSSTYLCTIVQDNSNEINFQKIKEVEMNDVHIFTNNNNILEEDPIGQIIEEINANNTNNVDNDEEIIDTGQLDINYNFLKKRKEIEDKDKEEVSKDNLEQVISNKNQMPFFAIDQLKRDGLTKNEKFEASRKK